MDAIFTIIAAAIAAAIVSVILKCLKRLICFAQRLKPSKPDNEPHHTEHIVERPPLPNLSPNHQIFVRLIEEGKLRFEVNVDLARAFLAHHPSTTAQWRHPIGCTSIAITGLTIIGIALFFLPDIGWVIGVLLICFAWLPLRKGSEETYYKAITEEALRNQQFLHDAVRAGVLRVYETNFQ